MINNNTSPAQQNMEKPLIVGGGHQEYFNRQFLTKRQSNYRKIFSIVITVAQLFILGSVLYYFLIKPILITKETNEKYVQPTIIEQNERDVAEKRYEEIYQNKDIAACDEFKNKKYRNPKEMSGGTTSFYYTCVYNLSVDLKSYQSCLSLNDNYSKRICLQGIATVFKDPKYCQEADSYAQDEVTKEQYSLAATDNCYFNIKACAFIKDISNKEGCFLFAAREENVLNINLCRSFIDPKRKEDCLEMVAVLEDNPQYCQESKDEDHCYWSVVKITAPNMGRENAIMKKEWCRNIKNRNLQDSCWEQ